MLYIDLAHCGLRNNRVIVPRILLRVGGICALCTVGCLHKISHTLHKEHAGSHHTYCHCSEQIHKDSNNKDNDKHNRIGHRDPQEIFKPSEIYNSPSYGNKNTCQNRERHIFYKRAKAKQYCHEQQRVHHSAQFVPSSRFYIYHCSHSSACARNTAEETCNGISYTLTDKLLIAVMLGLCNVVCNNRGKQSIYGAQAGKGKSRNYRSGDDMSPVYTGKRYLRFCKERKRQTAWNLTNYKFVVQIQKKRDKRHYNKGHQGRWNLLSYKREELYNQYCTQTKQKRGYGDAGGNRCREICNHIHNQHWRLAANDWIYLLQNYDYSNTAHKAGENRIWNISYIFAYPYQPKGNLKESAEDSCQRHCNKHSGEVSAGGDPHSAYQTGGNHSHWPSRAAYLRMCTSKERGKKSKKCRSHQSRKGSY